MGNRKLPHTGVWRGKRVLVVLKDGTQFIDHFNERSNTHCFFKSGRKVHKSLIRAFSIYKGDTHSNPLGLSR